MGIGPLPLWPLHITEPLAVGCGEIGHVLKDAADAGFPAQAYPSAVTGDDLAQGFSIGQAAADLIEGDVAVHPHGLDVIGPMQVAVVIPAGGWRGRHHPQDGFHVSGDAELVFDWEGLHDKQCGFLGC